MMGRLCKGDVRKAEADEKWREKGADRETWKGVTAGAMQQHKGTTRTNTFYS